MNNQKNFPIKIQNSTDSFMRHIDAEAACFISYETVALMATSILFDSPIPTLKINYHHHFNYHRETMITVSAVDGIFQTHSKTQS